VKSYDEEVNKLQQSLAEVSQKLFNRGLTSGVSGNCSTRVPGMPDRILIKATGLCLQDVCEDDFILVDLDGNALDGSLRPSMEVRFHCGIYKIRPEVKAIVHGHSVYATAYVTAKDELPIVTAAAEAGLNKIGIVGFAPPGSEELARMVIDVFQDMTLKAAVLKRHGFITLGQDIHKAYYLADVLEDNAKVAYIIEQLRKS
jgi:ribulose-5-phosphate 4-epimerase/fuculose-1-phosphate aldolase